MLSFQRSSRMLKKKAQNCFTTLPSKRRWKANFEPVYWKGQVVGHIRKIDNRLRIEMLRAYKPKTFTTPGTKIAINTGTMIGGNAVIIDTQEQDRLIELRQEALQKMQERRVAALPVA
jgi:hypothetical protein